MGNDKDQSTETNRATQHDAPPTYSPSTSELPSYDSLTNELHADVRTLSVGDPEETILVPMISRKHEKSPHDLNPFSRKTGTITHSVSVRKMKRDFYLKHYVKDAEGNFIGTGNPAPDVALVFVPGKSTPEDLMKQVREVAFGKQAVRGHGIGPYGKPQ